MCILEMTSRHYFFSVFEMSSPSSYAADALVNHLMTILQSNREARLGRNSVNIYFRVFYSNNPKLHEVYRKRAIKGLHESREMADLPPKRRRKAAPDTSSDESAPTSPESEARRSPEPSAAAGTRPAGPRPSGASRPTGTGPKIASRPAERESAGAPSRSPPAGPSRSTETGRQPAISTAGRPGENP